MYNSAARVLQHLMQASEPLSIKDMTFVLKIKYHTIYKAIKQLEANKFVIKVDKRGKDYLYAYNPEGPKNNEAVAYVEQQLKGLVTHAEFNKIMGRSLMFGWDRDNQRPLEDFLKSFALRPHSLKNAQNAPGTLALIVAELYSIALNPTDVDWQKHSKLEGVSKKLDEVEKALDRIHIFVKQLQNCQVIWDGRVVTKNLIDNPKVDKELIVELCNKILENYVEVDKPK